MTSQKALRKYWKILAQIEENTIVSGMLGRRAREPLVRILAERKKTLETARLNTWQEYRAALRSEGEPDPAPFTPPGPNPNAM